MPELLVSKNIITPRLGRALYNLQWQGWSPVWGRLRGLCNNREADLIQEVVEAWQESQLEGREEEEFKCTCKGDSTCEAHRA